MNAFFRNILLFAILSAQFTACQRPLIVDDDPSGNTDDKWELVDYESERQIQGLHATPFEWYLISENQFARFDGENGLLEKRPLDPGSGLRGIPAMSDNTFVRLGATAEGKDVLEFHLAKSPLQVKKIQLDSLAGNGEYLEAEFFGRYLGGFSTDGVLFMLPVKVLPSNHYAFFIFEIRLNQAANAFVSVKKIRRTDVEELVADIGSIKTIRYLGGNFYVATEEGGWRITPAGVAEQVFYSTNVLDFFAWKGDLYSTGYFSYDLHKSTDNGLTWERQNMESGLQTVEPRNIHLFSAPAPGNAYQLVGDDLGLAKEIAYPSTLKNVGPVFFGVAFFAGHYYFSADRKVYFTKEIITR